MLKKVFILYIYPKEKVNIFLNLLWPWARKILSPFYFLNE